MSAWATRPSSTAEERERSLHGPRAANTLHARSQPRLLPPALPDLGWGKRIPARGVHPCLAHKVATPGAAPCTARPGLIQPGFGRGSAQASPAVDDIDMLQGLAGGGLQAKRVARHVHLRPLDMHVPAAVQHDPCTARRAWVPWWRAAALCMQGPELCPTLGPLACLPQTCLGSSKHMLPFPPVRARPCPPPGTKPLP